MLAFAGLIVKNVWRQRARTLLTVLGISLGIATIVALGVLVGGLKGSVEDLVKSGEADFSVAQANVADFSFSRVTTDQVERIRETPGVKNAVGVLWGFAQTRDNPFFTLLGIDRSDVELMGLKITKGRIFRADTDEIAIGKIAVKNMDLKIGDDLETRGRDFKIVGVYETGNPVQDGGAVIALETLQEIEQKPGQVTMVLVKVADQVKNLQKFADKLERKFSGKLVTIVSISDYASVDQGIEIMDFLSAAISILAVVIGGIGVMNTIMMSVFERTREIGILRAIGWKKRRVLSMVLGESLLLGGISIIVGAAVGLAVVAYIMTYPVMEAFFRPDYSPAIFQRAALVGLLVSFFGGIYPAYRATRFSPAEALRYE